MPWSIANELRREFHTSNLRSEMANITSARQREQATRLMDRCESVRQRETELYNKNYLTRVEVARRRIIHQAGAKVREFNHPWAYRDRFSTADTLRQAQRDIQFTHERRIAKIDEIETRGLEDLMQRSMRQNLLRGKSRVAFAKATNRRSGLDRRGPSR